MKTVASLMVLGVLLQGATAFMCYTKSSGSDSRGVTLCFKGSCYSIGAGLLGAETSEKGCYESAEADGCLAMDVVIVKQHTCFCNTFLCNASSLPSSPLLMLLLLPCLLVRLL